VRHACYSGQVHKRPSGVCVITAKYYPLFRPFSFFQLVIYGWLIYTISFSLCRTYIIHCRHTCLSLLLLLLLLLYHPLLLVYYYCHHPIYLQPPAYCLLLLLPVCLFVTILSYITAAVARYICRMYGSGLSVVLACAWYSRARLSGLRHPWHEGQIGLTLHPRHFS
jgi:hypothetical protein